MEDCWLLSAIYDDDLAEKVRDRRKSCTSRNPSINVPCAENEALSISSESRVFDECYHLPVIAEPRKSFQMVPKPPLGTAGRYISLLTNHFPISSSGSLVFEYHIKIEPDIPSKKLNRKILNSLKLQVPELQDLPMAFDGVHSVYTTIPFDLEKVDGILINVTGVVNTKDSPNKFKITVKFVDSFQLNTNVCSGSHDPIEKLRRINAIDTIFRQTSAGRFHAVLQSFFSIASSPYDSSLGLGWGTVNLGVGREVCYGFYQNVVETFDTLTMNLDVATTTFYRPIALVEFLADVLEVPLIAVTDGRILSEAQKKKFSREIQGLKVETRHCNGIRRFRVARCTWKAMDNITLNLTNKAPGQDAISILDYYKTRYNINLKYRHLPCIEVGRSKECILPLELCYVVSGQRCIKKLNELQIANLIKATSRNATERKDAVTNLRSRLKMDNDPNARQFGLKVEPQLKKIEGRVLPPPRLLYCDPCTGKQECVTVPNNGSWDMRGKNFFSGITIQKWALVCFASSTIINPNMIRAFMRSLETVAAEIGMPFLDDHCFCRYAEPDQAVKILDFLDREHSDLQLIICIVPGKSTVYAEIKRKGDQLGLTTQCVRTQNVIKVSPHTLSNLCMKINSKLGGINVILTSPPSSVSSEPVLFVGCHISRNTVGNSCDSSSSVAGSDTSIACLVSSMDGHPTRFSPFFRVQPRHHQTIVGMTDMMKEAIITFKKCTGFKPHKIVIYRSGIVDGNANEILQTEIRAIRLACAMIEEGFQPGITLIGLDVNHHTRLFPVNERDRVGVSQNVPAGTLVETGITVNNHFEFFLVSHAGIQGTSRPTKYLIMWDDNQMPTDDIHEMTYQLCHTQSRCTRSVSIPSPVYYAKLVAQRAKILMADENFKVERFNECARSEGMPFT